MSEPLATPDANETSPGRRFSGLSGSQLFDAVDENGNGLISYDEFQVWWEAQADAAEEAILDELAIAWATFDQDGSGDLDEHEFSQVSNATQLLTSYVQQF